MNITVERRLRGADRMVARLEQIAAPAGKLVTDKLGGRVPHVEIVITDTAGMLRLANHYQNQVAGGASMRARICQRVVDEMLHRGKLATTVVTPRGVAVVIDGPKHLVDGNFDRTFVHEMVHAVQLGHPAARQEHIAYIRQCLGVDKLDKAFIKQHERTMATVHERQAENLEVLARHLPKGN